MFLLLSSGDVLMSRPLVKEQSITKITHKKTNEKVKKKFFFDIFTPLALIKI